ncbi:hypothetical protein D8674_030829 [Pyrus ussuriensis x Pyrus communis]|uniref:Uncharacterized protein n=1 Tax=Pyrus ussuriensis x Pyrus communis TaxID=2448454 RepID=A0A5N5EWR1_9ROSA|nr:hypothetical protein D8674_030829 [Pyrus ussuriensis x Pyrus communis]
MTIYNVMYFSNNQQQLFVHVNVAAPQINRRNGRRNNILAFAILTILTLLQMRYPQQDLFQTYPTLTMITMSSVLAYCIAFTLLELLLLVLVHIILQFWFCIFFRKAVLSMGNLLFELGRGLRTSRLLPLNTTYVVLTWKCLILYLELA